MAPSWFRLSGRVPTPEEDAEAIKEQQNSIKKRTSGLDKHFIRTMCHMIFVLYLLVTAGFGVLELYSSAQPTYAVAPISAIISLLISSVIPGALLAFLSIFQYLRINKGKVSEDSGVYRIYFWWVVATTALLLLLWLIFLFV